MMPEVSLVMTFHDVARLAQATVTSLEAAIETAERANISMEMICVLDVADQETINFCNRRLRSGFSGLKTPVEIVSIMAGDVGIARNVGAQKAHGTFISMADSDDLFSSNWLLSSYQAAKSIDGPTVFHPELVVHFEGQKLLAPAIESQDSEALKEYMWSGSLGGPTTFAHRQVYLDHQYPTVDTMQGFGYEDWHWACETIAYGVQHRLVPDTILCYRVKVWKTSMYARYRDANLVMPASKLYAPAYGQGIQVDQ